MSLEMHRYQDSAPIQLAPLEKREISGTQAKKQLKKIEAKVDKISEQTMALNRQLMDGLMSVEKGKSSVTNLGELKQQIESLNQQLNDYELQLAQLVKYTKSKKIAVKVLENKNRIEVMRNKSAQLEGMHPEMTSFFQKKEGVEAFLRAADGDKSHAGQHLALAAGALQEMAAIAQSAGSSGKVMDQELLALRAKMTAVAKEQLPLSRKEQKIIQKYEHVSKIKKGDVKLLREALLKQAVAELYFPSIPDDGRKNLVNRWLNGFALGQDAARYKVLQDKLQVLSTVVADFQKGQAFHIDADPSVAQQPQTVEVNEHLGTELRKQKLSRKEKQWTKVDLGFFTSSKSDIARIGKEVEKIGHQCLKANRLLGKRTIELYTGKVNHYTAQQEIEGISKMIEDAEAKLNQLQEKTASLGVHRSSDKVQKVISRQRNLINSLRQRKDVLEKYAQQDFHVAVQTYNELSNAVDSAIKDEKRGGVELYKAVGLLKKLQSSPAYHDDTSPIHGEVRALVKKGERQIQAALSLGASSLTPHKESLKQRLLEAYTPQDFFAAASGSASSRRIAIILSKEITAALYFTEGGEKVHKMQEVATILAHIGKHDPELLRKVEAEVGMKDILGAFRSLPAMDSLAQATQLQSDITALLQEAVMDKERGGVKIFQVMQHMEQFAQVVAQCPSPELKQTLGRMQEEIWLEVVAKGSPHVALSEHKQSLKNDLNAGKVGSEHNVNNLTLILSRDITNFLYLALESQKAELGQSIVATLENLLIDKPAVYDALMKDDAMREIIQAFMASLPPEQTADLLSLTQDQQRLQQKMAALNLEPQVVDSFNERGDPAIANPLGVSQAVVRGSAALVAYADSKKQLEGLEASIQKMFIGTDEYIAATGQREQLLREIDGELRKMQPADKLLAGFFSRANEVRSSDDEYVQDLERFVSVLEGNATMKSKFKEEVALLKKLAGLNRQFNQELHQAIQADQVDIGRLNSLMESPLYRDLVEVYGEYSTVYDSLLARVAADQKLTAKLNEAFAPLNFGAYAIKPIQRLTKIPLLLRDLAKDKPAGTPGDLGRALELAEQGAGRANMMRAEFSALPNFNKLNDIIAKMRERGTGLSFDDKGLRASKKTRSVTTPATAKEKDAAAEAINILQNSKAGGIPIARLRIALGRNARFNAALAADPALRAKFDALKQGA